MHTFLNYASVKKTVNWMTIATLFNRIVNSEQGKQYRFFSYLNLRENHCQYSSLK